MKSIFINNVITVFLKDFTTFGSLIFQGFFVIILFLLGYIKTSFLIFTGHIIITILIIIIRSVYFKDRPKKQKFKSYLEKIDASSFPSFHATRVTFLAYIMYSISLYLGLFFTLIAIIVIYSRLILKKHDIYDVSSGTILGIIIGFFISLI